MVGLISEPAGSATTQWEDMGGQVPSSVIDATPWLRYGNLDAASVGNVAATYGTSDDYGQQITPPEPWISADERNQRYGIDGELHFDNPGPESVAQEMNTAKHAEMVRRDAAARRPGGFVAGVTNFAAGTAAMLLDPVSAASLFIPVLPEGRIAEALAQAGLEGLAGRTVARVATGAGSGAIQMGALALPTYALSKQEQADYGASDMLWDTLYGAALGGFVHGAIGLGREALGGADDVTRAFEQTRLGQVMATDPAARQGVMNAALAAVVEDRPVDVEPLGEVFDRAAYVQERNARAVVMARTASLQREADALRAEAEQVPSFAQSVESPESMIRPPALDPATQARVDAVLNELTDPAHPPSATRRAQLLGEHKMLTQGQAPGDLLEQARSEAQRRGLLTAAARIEEEIRALRVGRPGTASTHPDIDGWHIGDPLPADIAEAQARSTELAQNPTSAIPAAERDPINQQAKATVAARRTAAVGGAIATERKAVIIMGPPASGKSTIAETLARRMRGLLLDSDDVKEALPEFDGGIGASRVHQESSQITEQMRRDAMRHGANLVLPIVGSDAERMAGMIGELKDAGYHVTLIHNDLPIEQAARRSMVRFREQGRVIPLDYLLGLEGKLSRHYEQNRSLADEHATYSNDVPRGHAPRLQEPSSADPLHEGGGGPDSGDAGPGGPGGGGDSPAGSQAGGSGEGSSGSDQGVASELAERIANSETVRQAGGGLPREMQAVSDAADRAAAQPPLKPGAIPPEIEAHIADLTESLQRSDATGLLTAADHAQIEAANSWMEQAKLFGQGALQAAACVARGLM